MIYWMMLVKFLIYKYKYKMSDFKFSPAGYKYPENVYGHHVKDVNLKLMQSTVPSIIDYK